MGFDFICPTCLMAEGEHKGLNSIADIAYSMPHSLFQRLFEPLQ